MRGHIPRGALGTRGMYVGFARCSAIGAVVVELAGRSAPWPGAGASAISLPQARGASGAQSPRWQQQEGRGEGWPGGIGCLGMETVGRAPRASPGAARTAGGNSRRWTLNGFHCFKYGFPLSPRRGCRRWVTVASFAELCQFSVATRLTTSSELGVPDPPRCQGCKRRAPVARPRGACHWMASGT